MMWPTPKENGSPNAACNKFLGLCREPAPGDPPLQLMIEVPGNRSFKAELLGWDSYSMILRLESGKELLMFKAPGTKIYPAEGFPKKGESTDGQRDSDGSSENAGSDN